MSNLTTKCCVRCGMEYPLTSEYFNKDKYKKSGFVSVCKKCRVKSDVYNRNKKAIINQGRECQLAFHICPRCNAQYPYTREYWTTAKENRSGLSSYCNACNSEKAKAYRSENIESVREKDRIRGRNIDPSRKRKRYLDWMERHPNRQQELNHLYHVANAERIRSNVRQWQKDNPEKVRMQWHKRRCRELEIPGVYTEDEIKQLYAEQKGLCFHCGTDLSVTGFHRDHWIPVTRPQSTNYISNIKLLCPLCNSRKYNKLAWEWHPEIYKKPDDYPDC